MEVIKTFEGVSQKKLNYKTTNRRDGDVSLLFASAKLAEQKLNLKAQRGLKDMIKSSWNWEKGLMKN